MWTIAPYANHEDLYALQDNVSKVQGNHLLNLAHTGAPTPRSKTTTAGRTSRPSTLVIRLSAPPLRARLRFGCKDKQQHREHADHWKVELHGENT